MDALEGFSAARVVRSVSEAAGRDFFVTPRQRRAQALRGAMRTRLGILFGAIAAFGAAAAPPALSVDVRPGEDVAFEAALEGSSIELGPARRGPIGSLTPAPGEILLRVKSGSLTPYAHLELTEKTPVPIDMIATGFIDRIKIDEVALCGRLDSVVADRIAAGSLRVSLSRFAVGTGVDTCK